MKRLIQAAGAMLAAALVLGVYGSIALADNGSNFNYSGGSDGNCTNVQFPQADWFGPGISGPNAVSVVYAQYAIAYGGRFWVARIASGASDLYGPWTASPPVVGRLSSDGIHTYVSVAAYVGRAGDCPISQYIGVNDPNGKFGLVSIFDLAKYEALKWPLAVCVKGYGLVGRLSDIATYGGDPTKYHLVDGMFGDGVCTPWPAGQGGAGAIYPYYSQ